MNDDYLWDRTGEPDPKIQQLEQVLGSLRYQPRPLKLPAQQRLHSRTLVPRIAIAAAVGTILAGGAAWLLLHKQNARVGLESASVPPAVEQVKTPPINVAPPAKDQVAARSTAHEALQNKRKRPGVRKDPLPVNRQFRSLGANGTELTARDRAEAETAKEQLLLALRVTSEKLSLAQKKAQGGYPGNLIRNQHKVG